MPLKSTNRISVLVLICFINLYIKAQTTIVNQPFSSTIPSGWSADASSWTLNTNYATNDHTPNDYCASIASGKPSKYIYIPVTMLAGAKYDLSFWTKRIGGISVYINETADQVTPLFTYTVTQTLDNNWKQTTCTSYIALTSGQFYFQIAYTGSTYGSGTAYLDDVQLNETSSGNQNSWSITGSSGTNMVSNFIGTTDAQGLVFKTNNIERAQFDLSGNFVLNTGGIFKNDLKLEKGFTFDGVNGIRQSINANTGLSIFKFGGPISTNPVLPCDFPSQDPLFWFGGRIQLFDQASNTSLSMGSDNYQSSIESSGNNGLLVNYYCGKNTYFNTNSSLSNGGGTVFMGTKVSMAKNVGIGNNTPNQNIDANTALNIFANENNMTALKLNVWNGTVKAIDVVNTDGTENFSVLQNGTISSKNLSGSGIRTLLVDATGKLVAGSASSTTATAWNLGGNNITVPTNANNEYFGTSSNSDLILATNAIPKMLIKDNGKIGFGGSFNPSSDFEFFKDNADCQVKLTTNNGAKIPKLTLNNGIYSADIYLGSNATSPSPIVMDWAGKHFLSFNNGNMLIGDPDNLVGEPASGGDIYTKLTISAKTSPNANSWNLVPLRIVNPDLTSTNKCIFEVLNDGTTHIGNTKPTNAPYSNAKLSVDGSIVAKEIFVRDQQGAQWADYVFEKDYKLMPLKEVQEYIYKNRHLPNVPSTKEIEENGQGIGKLQVVQMEKIEELYLHMIELNKKLEKLEKENAELKLKFK
jgi:hypothetical protein